MSEKRPQTFANHARLDPWFHFMVAPIFLLCFIFALWLLVRHPDSFHVWLALLSLGLLLLTGIARLYSLKVQDRVIRLEERLRLTALLQEPLRSRIHELTERQLIALRFAPDAEIPALVEKTLRDHLKPADIKKSIEVWRPDYWRV